MKLAEYGGRGRGLVHAFYTYSPKFNIYSGF